MNAYVYVRSVQLRVVNVIKKWLQQHFYDFGESDECVIVCLCV